MDTCTPMRGCATDMCVNPPTYTPQYLIHENTIVIHAVWSLAQVAALLAEVVQLSTQLLTKLVARNAQCVHKYVCVRALACADAGGDTRDRTIQISARIPIHTPQADRYHQRQHQHGREDTQENRNTETRNEHIHAHTQAHTHARAHTHTHLKSGNE